MISSRSFSMTRLLSLSPFWARRGNMSVNNQSRGLSENDNEMAGRLLLMGALAVAAVVFLALCPILIAGFLIALTWYGAYMEDGEPNGERLAMPVIITGALFIYLLGIPPAGDFFSGTLLDRKSTRLNSS